MIRRNHYGYCRLYVDMKINLHVSARTLHASYRQLVMLPLLLVFLSSASASDSRPYPEFTAVYDARLNGIRMAEASFSLHRLDNGDYEYQQKSKFNISSKDQAEKIIAALEKWIK